MANPLFNLLGGNMTSQNFGPFGNMMNLMNQFQQFKSTFQGNPQQKVQELLNNGQMTQTQFNTLSQWAGQFQKMMGKH